MTKRAKFCKIEEQIIITSLSQSIPIDKIAESLERDIESVKSKIWRMGLKLNCPPKRKQKMTKEQRINFMERHKQYLLQKEKQEKELRDSIHPYLSQEWQETLMATGAKLSVWNGQKTLMLDGKPTTVHAIRERYKIIVSFQGSAAVEQCGQANRQSIEKEEGSQ